MDNIFLYAGFIAGVYFIAKFLEMRYVEQESKPLRILVRDSLLVYVCVIFGHYAVEQIQPSLNEALLNTPPVVFNDNPDF